MFGVNAIHRLDNTQTDRVKLLLRGNRHNYKTFVILFILILGEFVVANNCNYLKLIGINFIGILNHVEKS